MMPVPFYQVIEFLNWIAETYPNLNSQELNSSRLQELALVYLRGGNDEPSPSAIFSVPLQRDGEVDSVRLVNLLVKIFQVCPMIKESTANEQMQHFAGCGQCLEYIEREKLNPRKAQLHPFLLEFLSYLNETELINIFRERAYSLCFREGERAFKELISELGPELRRSFEEYLRASTSSSSVRDYEFRRDELKRTGRRGSLPALHPQSLEDEGTQPLEINDNVEHEARRLAESVRFLVEGHFYEKQIRHNPEVYHLISHLGAHASEAAQSMEFIWWLQDKHPNLDILGNAPTNQIRELVTVFCEERNYKNAASFSKDVISWLRGKGERKVIRKLIEIGARAKRKNNTYKSTVSPLDRYRTVPYHAFFLFLSAGDFPTFIHKYWEDLNYLTGDHLDVYYSFEDLERGVSAFEVLGEFRSIKVEATSLPAMFLWGKDISQSCVIPLERLSHDDIFDVIKVIVQRISEGEPLIALCDEAIILVQEKLKSKMPTSTVIVKGGEVTIGNSYKAEQVGAMGPNSHAHDMTFTQVRTQLPSSIDLQRLANELSKLRQQMKREADDPEQDIAISDIAKAEQAARVGDNSRVIEHLKSVGDWTLEIASKIGASLVVDVIKQTRA